MSNKIDIAAKRVQSAARPAIGVSASGSHMLTDNGTPKNSEVNHRTANESHASGYALSPGGKRRRKRVTIIKKRREKDGSLSVSKHQVYDMSISRAIE